MLEVLGDFITLFPKSSILALIDLQISHTEKIWFFLLLNYIKVKPFWTEKTSISYLK